MKKRAVLLSNDKRFVYLEGILKEDGYMIVTPRYDTFIKDLLSSPSIILGPVQGSDQDGYILKDSSISLKLNEELISSINKDSIFIIGRLRPNEKEMMEKYKVNYYELLSEEGFTIDNSIPTGEGAIKIAIESSPKTLHGRNCLITGFGNVAKTLARMLDGIGAKIFIAARTDSDLLRATEIGYQSVAINKLDKVLRDMDYIFNTVPDLIFTKDLIEMIQEKAPIIELASLPGGFDTDSINKETMLYVNAPGLPGKVAPQSAADYIFQALKRIIRED
jgi:dipicolinate synthase subunit A